MAFLVPRHQHHMGNMWRDDFFSPFFDMGDMFGSTGFRVDIKDNEDHYTLEADLPGIPRNQIDILIENDMLTISADMNSEKQEGHGNYVYSERRSGQFQRSFSLEGIHEDGIQAKYNNGVLTLNLPKQEKKQHNTIRRIDIDSSDNDNPRLPT